MSRFQTALPIIAATLAFSPFVSHAQSTDLAINPVFASSVLQEIDRNKVDPDIRPSLDRIRAQFSFIDSRHEQEMASRLEGTTVYEVPDEKEPFLKIEGDGVRLRAGPSIHSEILGKLGNSSIVANKGKVKSWSRVVTVDGLEGFVFDEYTSVIQIDDSKNLLIIMQQLSKIIENKTNEPKKQDPLGGGDDVFEEDLDAWINKMTENPTFSSGSYLCMEEQQICKGKFNWFDCELLMMVCVTSVLLHGS